MTQLDAAVALERLMERYDRLYPTATPFERGHSEFAYRNTLDDMAVCGLAVVDVVAAKA